MLHHGAQARAFDLKPTLLEVLTSMRRSGNLFNFDSQIRKSRYRSRTD
jgi:hypothetical protein